MVVTSHLVDNIKDIHPQMKKEVGLLLANYALPETYGWAATLDRGNYMPGNSKVWVCREQPLQWMQQMGNTYAFSIAGVLDDRKVEDVKMPATLLMWDNAIYKPTQSGVYNGTLSTIPTAQRQMVHRLGNVKNVNSSVVQLYGDGKVVFFNFRLAKEM